MSLKEMSEKFAPFEMSEKTFNDSIHAYESELDRSTDVNDMIAALDVDLDRLELPAELALKTCDRLLYLARDNKKVAYLCSRFLSLYDEGRRNEAEELYMYWKAE